MCESSVLLCCVQDGVDVGSVGVRPLSRLVMSLKPRYHFAALHNTFYERIPYRYTHTHTQYSHIVPVSGIIIFRLLTGYVLVYTNCSLVVQECMLASQVVVDIDC